MLKVLKAYSKSSKHVKEYNKGLPSARNPKRVELACNAKSLSLEGDDILCLAVVCYGTVPFFMANL